MRCGLAEALPYESRPYDILRATLVLCRCATPVKPFHASRPPLPPQTLAPRFARLSQAGMARQAPRCPRHALHPLCRELATGEAPERGRLRDIRWA